MEEGGITRKQQKSQDIKPNESSNKTDDQLPTSLKRKKEEEEKRPT